MVNFDFEKFVMDLFDKSALDADLVEGLDVSIVVNEGKIMLTFFKTGLNNRFIKSRSDEFLRVFLYGLNAAGISCSFQKMGVKNKSVLYRCQVNLNPL